MPHVVREKSAGVYRGDLGNRLAPEALECFRQAADLGTGRPRLVGRVSRQIMPLFKSVAGVLVSLCAVAVMSMATAAGQSPKPWSLEWSKSAPFPEPRAGYAAGVLNGKLVIAGGTYWEGAPGHWTKRRFSASTHAFDPVTQQGEKLPDLPVPLGYAASATVGNQLFVLGGYTGTTVNRQIFTLQKTYGRYVWGIFGSMKIDRVFASTVSQGADTSR